MTERPTPAAASAIPMGSGELAAALRDPDPFVRVDALGRAEGNARAFELIGSALSDDYPLVRREAVRALARIGGASAARALLQVSAHDLAAEVREEAVTALARMLRVRSATGSDA